MTTLARDRSDAAPADLPSFGQTFSRMVAMAWPIMLGAVAMAVLHMGQIALLGHQIDKTPLLLLSLLMPFFLLFTAFLEAVAVTAQVFSARSRRDWPGRNVLDATVILAGAGIAIVGLLAGGAHAWRIFEGPAIPFVAAEQLAVLPVYLASLAPLLLFETANGALRGQGRTVPGFILLGVMVALNLGLCAAFVFELGLGFEGVLLANLVSGLVVAPIATFVLARTVAKAPRGPFGQALARAGLLLGVVGAPVFFSLVVAVFSSAVVVDLVAGFGADYVSGFLIVARLRFFFLIPAIALATALAVMVVQEHQSPDPSRRRALMRQGAVAILAIYAALTGLLALVHEPLIALVAADPALRAATGTILVVLLPTFFLVGVVAAAQVVLENIGRGVRVLIWTVLLEVGACAALLTLAATLEDALLVLLGIAGLYGLAFAFEYVAAILARPGAVLAAGDEDEDDRAPVREPAMAPAE